MRRLSLSLSLFRSLFVKVRKEKSIFPSDLHLRLSSRSSVRLWNAIFLVWLLNWSYVSTRKQLARFGQVQKWKIRKQLKGRWKYYRKTPKCAHFALLLESRLFADDDVFRTNKNLANSFENKRPVRQITSRKPGTRVEDNQAHSLPLSLSLFGVHECHCLKKVLFKRATCAVKAAKQKHSQGKECLRWII